MKEGFLIIEKQRMEAIESMMNHAEFDLWADGYDKSVGLSDEDGTYPFAGYREILNRIYSGVLSGSAKKVLDIGFGTGTLAARLYEAGVQIYGQDFSGRMTELALAKMPEAHLYQGDFSEGLTAPLQKERYDAIVATYSLHHLTDERKIWLLGQLLPLLTEDGCIYIGDVAFETREALNACRELAGEEWDDEEIYPVAAEMRIAFPGLHYEQISSCAGLFIIGRK